MQKVEILAPAGSFETLNAAINAGCDSVFFGIEKFNMRAQSAVNFTIEDLPKIVEICKKAGVLSYLTVNTILYDSDIPMMETIVSAAKSAGVDAIIASDIAAIMYGRKIGIDIHISTQLSVSNIEAVEFFSQFTDRIVLARELTLEQVAKIVDQIEERRILGPKGNLIEIEVFAHGAICVAVSGRCSMSLYCYGTSANKGKCTQVCRRRYKVTDVETGKELEVDNNYIMSASDLCTIGMLDKLVEAGVRVLKFEGRARGAEYVDTVVKCYSEALKSIEEGTYSKDKIDNWNKRLGTVFNRGQSTGFYMGRTFDEWAGSHGNKSTEEKSLFGVVEKFYSKISVAQIYVNAPVEVSKGEKFFITGPTTGIVSGVFERLDLDGKNVDTVRKGDVFTIKLDKKVRENDKVYVVRNRESLIPKGKEKLLQN